MKMKKLLLFAATLFMAWTACSQTYYWSDRFGWVKMWEGNSAVSLNGGGMLYLKKPLLFSEAFNFKTSPGYLLTVRFEYDKTLTGRWQYGYLTYGSFGRMGYEYTEYLTNFENVKEKWEMGLRSYDVNLGTQWLLGFWLNPKIEFVLGVGISNTVTVSWEVTKARVTDLSTRETYDEDMSDWGIPILLNPSIDVSFAAKYFFTENFFVHAILQDYIGVSIFMSSNPGNRMALSVGVGYKMLKEKE